MQESVLSLVPGP